MYYTSRVIKTSLLLTGLFFSFFALAQLNPFDIEFPIPELENCGSLEECRVYCDDLSHIDVCLTFAESRGFISSEEADHARDLNILHEKTGPGECQGPGECETFCSRPENHLTCIDFAEREGFLTSREATEARRFAGITGPGGCSTPESCDTYCSQPEHTEECILHAVENGFMSQEEADRILRFIQEGGVGGPHGPEEPEFDEEKAQQIIETIGGPDGCRTFDECDTFCSISVNEEICFAFAIEHGLMSLEDVERFKRLMEIEGPGGCQGRECEVYCEQFGHELECMQFAVEQGFMSQAEFDEVKKFIDAAASGGPGGCQGRECESYCNDPLHQDECFAFAEEHDLISPEEAAAFKRIDARVKESGGPGGCKGDAECRIYCSDLAHFNECAAFAVDVGLMSQEEAQRALREFIEVEQFGPPGGLPGEFSPPRFGPPGEFGPPGPGGFGPPPGFEAEFEQQFQQFEIFRQQFESGPRPEFGPPTGGFPPPGEFPPLGEFPPPGGFPFPQPSDGVLPGVVCPSLPTVDICPEGQQKVVAHSSSECGTYYICQSIEQPIPQPVIGPEPVSIDPATECANKGGVWDTAANFCRSPSSPSTTTQPSSTTIDPAVLCVSGGGTWDGSTCIFPQQLPRANPTLGSLIASLFAPFISLLNR